MFRIFNLRLIVVIAVLNLINSSSAYELDQQHDVPDRLGGISSTVAERRAQVFTAGRSGLLTSVDIKVAHNPINITGDLIVEIQKDIALGPLTHPMSILGSISVPMTDVPIMENAIPFLYPRFMNVDLSSLEISLTEGEQYALVINLSSIDSQSRKSFAWSRGRSQLEPYDGYVGGDSFYFSSQLDEPELLVPGFWENANGNYSLSGPPLPSTADFAFRTYVVPEPSMYLMAIFVGFLILIACKRRFDRGGILIYPE